METSPWHTPLKKQTLAHHSRKLSEEALSQKVYKRLISFMFFFFPHHYDCMQCVKENYMPKRAGWNSSHITRTIFPLFFISFLHLCEEPLKRYIDFPMLICNINVESYVEKMFDLTVDTLLHACFNVACQAV